MRSRRARAPLARQIRWNVAGALAGSVTDVLSVVAIASMFGLNDALTASLAKKSITAPAAMGNRAAYRRRSVTAAVFAVFTGMTGAAFVPALLDRLGVRDSMERRLAVGTASHGQGTARVLQNGEAAGVLGLGDETYGVAHSHNSPVADKAPSMIAAPAHVTILAFSAE
jgi:putative effector of murein hydrolase